MFDGRYDSLYVSSSFLFLFSFFFLDSYLVAYDSTVDVICLRRFVR